MARDLTPGRRVRTARVSAGLNRGQLAAKLRWSFNKLEMVETGRRAVSTDELLAIGEACEAPDEFMLDGWRPCTYDHKLDRVRESVEQMSATMQEWIREVRRDD